MAVGGLSNSKIKARPRTIINSRRHHRHGVLIYRFRLRLRLHLRLRIIVVVVVSPHRVRWRRAETSRGTRRWKGSTGTCGWGRESTIMIERWRRMRGERIARVASTCQRGARTTRNRAPIDDTTSTTCIRRRHRKLQILSRTRDSDARSGGGGGYDGG